MNEGLSPDQERLLKEWEVRNRGQRARVEALSDEGRRAWGFKQGETLEDKRERDEREGPSIYSIR